MCAYVRGENNCATKFCSKCRCICQETSSTTFRPDGVLLCLQCLSCAWYAGRGIVMVEPQRNFWMPNQMGELGRETPPSSLPGPLKQDLQFFLRLRCLNLRLLRAQIAQTKIRNPENQVVLHVGAHISLTQMDGYSPAMYMMLIGHWGASFCFIWGQKAFGGVSIIQNMRMEPFGF